MAAMMGVAKIKPRRQVSQPDTEAGWLGYILSVAKNATRITEKEKQAPKYPQRRQCLMPIVAFAARLQHG
jgi:hypothetical protein